MEFGWRPLGLEVQGMLTANTSMDIVKFSKKEFDQMRLRLPAMNYSLRKYRVSQNDPEVNWLLGVVSTEGTIQ